MYDQAILAANAAMDRVVERLLGSGSADVTTTDLNAIEKVIMMLSNVRDNQERVRELLSANNELLTRYRNIKSDYDKLKYRFPND